MPEPKTHYDLLTISPDSPPDEVKRAFRREIAKYHPDKVQHLGEEFQRIARDRTAELTEAYRVLMDPQLRAEYDQKLAGAGPARSPVPPAPGADASVSGGPPPGAGMFQRERASRDEFLRRAALARLRDAVRHAEGHWSELAAPGYDLAFTGKLKRDALITLKRRGPDLVGVKAFGRVDAEAIRDITSGVSTLLAGSANVGDVLLLALGSEIAPRAELAAEIRAFDKRRPGPAAPGPRIAVVPMDMRTWEALAPRDAPPLLSAIVARLRGAA